MASFEKASGYYTVCKVDVESSLKTATYIMLQQAFY